MSLARTAMAPVMQLNTILSGRTVRVVSRSTVALKAIASLEIPLDLTGISGPTLRVRLDAPPFFWLVDFVGIDFGKEHNYSSQRLTMLSAIDQKGRDLRQILVSADGREEQLETGDAVELRFSAPPLLPGKARSYMLRSTGWYRIHAPEEGLPDLTLLSAASAPGGIARISSLRMNAALESLKPNKVAQ